jgi:hypothetical protein
MDHGAFFPVASGTAHGAAAYLGLVSANQNSCTACHVSRTDRTNNSCASCHVNVPTAPTAAHTGVRGFSNTSPLCKACHADAQVMRLNEHPRDGNQSWHTHENATCQNCHINQTACLADANCYNNAADDLSQKSFQDCETAYNISRTYSANCSRTPTPSSS